MHRKSLLLSISLILSISTVCLLSLIDKDESLIQMISSNDGINQINVEYDDKKVYMNIHISKPLSCKQLIQTLDLSSISIRNKTYIPACSNISNSIIQIVYYEATEV